MVATKVRRQLYRNPSTAVSVSTTGGQIFGSNPRRVAIIFSAPVTNRVTIGFGAVPVLDGGLNIYPATAWQILKDEHIGQAIREEIYGIAATAAEKIGILEIFEVDCECGVSPTMG